MDVLQALIQALGNGFFPIIVCAILFWYVYKRDQLHKEETQRRDEQHREEVQKRDEQHREELKELSKSIENNTLVIQKLVDKLDGD